MQKRISNRTRPPIREPFISATPVKPPVAAAIFMAALYGAVIGMALGLAIGYWLL